MTQKIIVAGSEGLLGKEIVNFLSGKCEVLKLDVKLGHDLTDEDFVIDFFKNNPADYLINSFALNDHVQKGETREQNLFNTPLETLMNYLKINTVALFSVCREFARNERAQGIVNFASTYSLVSSNPVLYNGKEKNIAYVISKASVPQLTRHLAVHLAPRIRVNCVIPHGVENNQGDSFITQFIKLSPMKRLMKKDEINGIIEYLCSDKSAYMTGSIVTIDGGWTAW